MATQPQGDRNETHVREIAKLHRDFWEKGGAEVRVGDKSYRGSEVRLINVGDLQTAMWTDRRPVVLGNATIESAVWGNLRPYIANLNAPHELFKLSADLGYAYYLLCLSIVLGTPLSDVSLPAGARVSVPEYDSPPFSLLEMKHARRRQGRPEIVSSLAMPHDLKRLVVSLTLKELSGLLPPEGSVFPKAGSALHAIRAAGIAEDLVDQPFGLWRKLPEIDGNNALYEGIAVIYLPKVRPEMVFSVMRQREKWIEFYPGLFGIEKVNSISSQKEVYRLEFGTPLGPIHIIAAHSDSEADLQVRWEDPAQEDVERIAPKEGVSGTVIKHVTGSMTFHDAVDGTYLCYSLAMDAPKFNVQGTREVGLMNRVVPIALSAHARALNPTWGFPAADPSALKARIAQYKANFNAMNRETILKGPPAPGAIQYSKVWTVENQG